MAPKKVAKAAAKSEAGPPPNLLASSVFVRIRPLADSGGHADDGSGNVQKILAGFDGESVTIGTQYLFSTGEAKYTFPKKVLGPETSQQEAYAEMLPELVDAFTEFGGSNVLFFCYGQTGTGKTRTMFGTEASLAQRSPHAEWGIFPRVCFETFAKFQQREGIRFILTASAIEFYMGEAFDLLNDRSPVAVDFDSHAPYGETCIVFEEPGDVIPFVQQVIAKRTSRSTNFNQASTLAGEQHSGSSRSHAMLIFGLMQLHEDSGAFVRTTFTLADLAGAERPSKTEDRAAKSGLGPEFLPGLMQQKREGTINEKDLAQGGKYEIPLNFQTQVINWELSELSREVLKATEQHLRRKPYAPPKSCCSPAIQFLTAVMNGRARLCMVVTLSSSPQNGWETWFSLQYGTDLAKLRVPQRNEKPHNFAKLLAAATKEAERCTKEVESAPQNKYYFSRKMKANGAVELVRRLQMMDAATGAKEATPTPAGAASQGSQVAETLEQAAEADKLEAVPPETGAEETSPPGAAGAGAPTAKALNGS